MNSLIVKFLKLFIWFYPKFEKLFGLSSLGHRSSVIVKFVSISIKTAFVVIYPIACSRFLFVFTSRDSRATTYARNLTFAFNWILLVSIYSNEISFRGYRNLQSLFHVLIEVQSLKQNLILLLKCTLKAAVLGSVLLKLNVSKYNRLKKRNLGPHDENLMFFLLLPFFVMILASNRIYMANTVVKHFLVIFKHNQLSIKYFERNYGRLHDFFVSFNKANSINFATILCFCVLNIIYEVWQEINLNLAKKDFAFLQAYFISQMFARGFNPRTRVPLIVCCLYLSCYLLELFIIIRVFEDVKTLSKDLTSYLPDFNHSSENSKLTHLRRGIINQKNFDLEIFLLRKIHQDFTFLLYGVKTVDSKLLSSVKWLFKSSHELTNIFFSR